MTASAATLFFAVAVPAEVRALAVRCQAALGPLLGPARFTHPEDLHLTLAFLGSTELTEVPALLRLAAAARGPAIPMRTAALGGFPRPARARILWLGFDPQPALAALAERLRAALGAAQVPFDPKPFLPHLTLARTGEPVDLARIPLPDPEPLAFTVDRIRLFQSLPAPQGARYHLLG